jgi:protein-S-isoprenylcysteine O-methyltransferase Ste14
MIHILVAIAILFSSAFIEIFQKIGLHTVSLNIFIGTYVVWFLSEIIFNRLLRSKNKNSSSKDNGTLKLIWILIFIAIFLAVYLTNFNFLISKSVIISYLGLSIIVAGIILRTIIIISLGKFFTVDVAINKNHKLKTNGFYKYIRHPSYTASLLSFIGFGISLNNWASLLVVITILLIAFLIRIKTEEEVLANYFGMKYLAYKKNTKKIIPFIY